MNDIIENTIKQFENLSGYKYNKESDNSPAIKFQRNFIEYFIKKKDKILEVGCGGGLILDYLIDKGYNVFGIDVSEKMLSGCRNIDKTQVMDARKLKFNDNSFDVCYANGVLLHIDGINRIRIISEMLRVAPKSIITASYSWFSKILTELYHLRIPKKSKIDNGIYIQSFTISELKNIVEKSNGKIIRIIGDYGVPFFHRFKKLGNIIRSYFPYLCTHINLIIKRSD